MGFAEEHEKWYRKHLAKRRGERRDALLRGHGYGNRLFAEHVWWPMLGHFDGLHPEYEVLDWRHRSYFVDFMYIAGKHHWVIEIMDYGSHGKDRSAYRKDLNRALFLQSLGFGYIEVSLDELKENPAFIRSMLRSILGPYLQAAQWRGGAFRRPYGKVEREIAGMKAGSARTTAHGRRCGRSGVDGPRSCFRRRLWPCFRCGLRSCFRCVRGLPFVHPRGCPPASRSGFPPGWLYGVPPSCPAVS